MLPKQVITFGVLYTVKEDDLRGMGDDGNDLCGRVLFKKRLILIEKTMDRDNKILTLLHELGHATAYRLGLYLTESWKHDIEELCVENINVANVENFDIYPKGYVAKLERRIKRLTK